MSSNLDIDIRWIDESTFNFFGPCSAESSEQILATAEGIHKNFNDLIFRAGIWKPRTRPDSFSGIGSKGLTWLKEVQSRFGFKVSTEVANAKHVELCLKNGIDVLWIGARTTVSPFSVQEIADALKGHDIPVFVKNPIHDDLALWIGALERMNQAGITKLGAIHRGFHQMNSEPYRNAPKWNIPIELKRNFSNLPIICDVSHISGKPSLIPSTAQLAIDLNFDGLMIETHIDPSEALSDAKQQVSPAQLKDIIDNLVNRESTTDNVDYTRNLEILRSEIDHIDGVALEQMAKRMALAKKIGLYKKENKVTIFQVDRWKSILEKSTKKGASIGLSERFVEDLLNAIHNESIRQQNDIMNPDDK